MNTFAKWLSWIALVIAIVAFVVSVGTFISIQASRADSTSVSDSDQAFGSSKTITSAAQLVADEKSAQSSYGEYLKTFANVDGASSTVKRTCADIRKAFVDGKSFDAESGSYDAQPITFDNPADPIGATDNGRPKCQAVNAYRQQYLSDGDIDPGYGVRYRVSTRLSVNASADMADEKDGNGAHLYSRYKGDAYLGDPITGPACSIQNGSSVTYLRTIDSGVSSSDYGGSYGYGTLVRYTRPSQPVRDSEASRYAGTRQCDDNQMIVVPGFADATLTIEK